MNLKNIDDKRKRLIYRAWHRGTREMDLLLGSFADQNVAGFKESEIEMFEALMLQSDPDLYNWITGQEDAPANVVNDIFQRLQSHKYK